MIGKTNLSPAVREINVDLAGNFKDSYAKKNEVKIIIPIIQCITLVGRNTLLLIFKNHLGKAKNIP
ncbi:hypothetical protein [Pedobacter sp. NJ-S-72]